MKPAALALLLPLMSTAANYSAQKTSDNSIEIVRLTDAAHKTEVAIAPSFGNMAYEMKVNGKNILFLPVANLAELRAKPALAGVPFLWPWANRIDGDAYWANGKKYLLNPELGNFRYDADHKPIHGLLAFSPLWQATKLEADAKSARVTSRLEFAKHPELMAQFPFAHTVEMTYRLADGVLEVETLVRNESAEAIPVAAGYHPYFQLHDAPRDQWKVHLAAGEEYVLSDVLIPTGEKRPNPFHDPQTLAGTQLDNVFGGLVRGSDGRAHFWVTGKQEKISVIYGPKYPVAVVYAPPGKGFICFEPMAGITNAFNLAHAGIYKKLQSVPAGGEWRESFWIAPSGF
jgi:aldose 1-epimerase